MEWKEISVKDKELFNQYFHMHNYPVSDLNFTNLFIWHSSSKIKYRVIDGFLCIKVIMPETPPFLLMPLGHGNLKQVIKFLMDAFKKNNLVFQLRGITEPMRAIIEKTNPGQFIYTEQREHFDYIYAIEDLISLKGNKLQPKRNLVNRFQKKYNFHYEKITTANIHEIVTLVDIWCEKHDCDSNSGLMHEKKGILNAVQHFKALNFLGGMLKIDNEVVAFTFGDQLTDEMGVIHIEKANTSFEGAYQIMNKLFLNHEMSHLIYINREEDLGIEGLKTAKLSYYPLYLLKKYKAELSKV